MCNNVKKGGDLHTRPPLNWFIFVAMESYKNDRNFALV